MTFNEIAELIQYIPKDSKHFANLVIPDYENQSEASYEIELFAACYRDLAFRWHFVRSLVEANQRLPNKVKDAFIKKLYSYETSKTKDRHLTMAIGISRNMPMIYKNTIMAMLISGEGSYEEIAAHVGMPVETIVYFEKIFFNVVDRLEDHMYISSIPYPEGRIEEVVLGEKYIRNPTKEILKAGYNNGIGHAAYASGLKSDLVTEDFTTMAKRLENLIMSNGYFLAKNGYLNSYTPGLQHAKQIIAAAKQGDAENNTAEDYGPSLIGSVIMGELQNTMLEQVRVRKNLLEDKKNRG